MSEQPVQETFVRAPPRGSARWLGRLRRVLRYALHQLRWRWRFGSFGWRSTLRAPAILGGTRGVFLGSNVTIRSGARIETVGPGARIEIGDDTSIHLYFHVGAAREVRIGRKVLVAGHVYVSDHDHEPPAPGRPPASGRLLVEPVVIEDECWLGEGCRILKGVHLGRGCTVGANAVVTKSFPPYSIVGGVPARLIRRADEGVDAPDVSG